MEYGVNELFAGRYRLLRPCGKGSFGQVWLARDEQIDMEVAVKIYITLDSRGVEEFKSEFKSTYDLNHPNLLHATYFDVYQDRPYLVMPFCPSSSLSLIGQVDEKQLWRFIHDVSAGLVYLHEHNVIHRDIKPDNILMDGEGNFLISDFGISTKIRNTLRRNSTREHNADSSGGSLSYMGPELFSGHPEPVKATDIWAFGATLYELITGELPFMGHGGVMQLNGAAVPELSGTAPEAALLVHACMSKETWDRPTAAQIEEYAAARLNGEIPCCPWIRSYRGKKLRHSSTKSRPNSIPPNYYRKDSTILNPWLLVVISVLVFVVVAAINYKKNRDANPKENYERASEIKNDIPVKQKIETIAGQLGGVKLVDFVMLYTMNDDNYAERVDYRLQNGKFILDSQTSTISASKTTYLYSYFEFIGFSDISAEQYESMTFNVKIIEPDGNLLRGKTSPNGYSFEETVTDIQYYKSGTKIWLTGWGNESATTYKPGRYIYEVWYNERKLFSVPIRFI